VEVAQVHRG